MTALVEQQQRAAHILSDYESQVRAGGEAGQEADRMAGLVLSGVGYIKVASPDKRW